MTKPKANRAKAFRPVRRGTAYPMSGPARTVRYARNPISKEVETEVTQENDAYKLFVCVQCGFEYDEEKGWPEDGIAPGTRWDDIPDDWSCPDCGAAKSDFDMVEVSRS
jgi:rubredoxin